MDVLLLGVAPPNDEVPGAHGGPAFVGTDSGRRLAALAGFASVEEMEQEWYLRNCFSAPVDSIDHDAARDGALEAVWDVQPDVVVACGVTPRRALDLPPRWMDWVEWSISDDEFSHEFEASAIPHPSGRTRFWNDKNNVIAVHDFFTALRARSTG